MQRVVGCSDVASVLSVTANVILTMTQQITATGNAPSVASVLIILCGITLRYYADDVRTARIGKRTVNHRLL